MRMRTVFVGLVAFTAVTVGAIVFAARHIGDVPLPPLPQAGPCEVGSTPDSRFRLGAEQAANAATISAIGIRRGLARRAVVVALATAFQESKLTNLPGGDRDSVGLFQQRPSQGWGTAEQIADPRYATNRFYTALLKVKGWQKMRVTDAAQAVQQSAHPEAYDQWVARAETLAAALAGDVAGAVNCTISDDPPLRGAAAVQGVVDTLRLDWGDLRPARQATTLTVTVRDGKAGWQYAHWLVAHATDLGVRKVRFADQEWHAEPGSWARSSATPTAAGGNTVVAEVLA
jgi:hypothetical protein